MNRSTCYEYAKSPAELLVTVLRADLDEIRDAHVRPGVSVDESIGGLARAVFEHVDEHRDIYRRGLGVSSTAASLHAMLVKHFTASSRLLIESGPVHLPDHVDLGTTASYISYGTVGVLDAWVHTDPRADVDAAIAQLATLVPEWWPLR